MKYIAAALLVLSWQGPGVHSSSTTNSADLVGIEEELDVDDQDQRSLQMNEPTWNYELPPWWSLISGSFTGINLKRCFKRQFPPVVGVLCAKSAKTCFFGTQECPGTGPYPTMKCFCNGDGSSPGTWSCEDVDCPPTYPTPPVYAPPSPAPVPAYPDP
eukprot:CAMPEP_0119005798 /NCGR_PEP_ID=MMETSP1176-20130426/1933_1 /TAXON_ID=265551 /ORGANISM="Synedropsis recta cf, Strain CCMP1620" /LENGTH=157 /DNA_ID=CAMNT_0006957643 /DNA_START=880 /DNA_END=1349 /DNA_ORIENTATION=+